MVTFLLCSGPLYRMEESLCWGEGDLEEKERIGEDVVESQADSYVDKKLTAVIMEGRLYTRN